MIKIESKQYKRPLSRTFLRIFGKIVVPLFFSLEKEGVENVPQAGPLILVGNHEGAMEPALMGGYVPRNVEMLAGDEFPQEKIVEIVKSLYGIIPVKRMFMDKSALELSLQILDKDGCIGIFPEGGVWNAGNMEPKLGAAWLSYYSRAPVLPVGFAGSKGAWHDAIRGKRPSLFMKFGELIPPVGKVTESAKKAKLREYSQNIWDTISELSPVEEDVIVDEIFDTYIYLKDKNENPVKIPKNLAMNNKNYLGQFLHNPGVIKLFRKNLELPVEVLTELEKFHHANKFMKASVTILDYLNWENPYLLLYRFSIDTGMAMKDALKELKNLSKWADNKNLFMKIVPVYEYYLPEKKQKVIKTKQKEFGKWI